MTNTPEEWLQKSISDGHINYLEYNKFTDLTIIGPGAFGKVFKCKWKDCELMLKLLRRVSNHPNIISFYGVTKNYDGHHYMVMQYANEGTLREYLKAEFDNLQWEDKLCIAREIALGLLFLHDNLIVHRDLHSKNILIHQKQPKIADLGLSKQINETSMMTSESTAHGMLAYIEPQCFIVPRYKRDKKSDVYRFGIILWEISSGRPPFESFDSFIIIES
ncbi:kinase-like protein [Gigaspora margarita]|uniref:Kinase-like protein n=1 Tax=Gigaspora margarita TaxID=4874 RepID=A0A8H4ETA7_GIGMA|nr:kinase-like protein [Gigaspora margarita]